MNNVAANRIWIDIETTGLVPSAGLILEIAVVATTADAEYRELASQTWVLNQDLSDCPLDHVVMEMHTKSGLIHEVPFGRDPKEVEAELCRFIDFFGNPAPGREPIAGSSVHTDAAWLRLHHPRVMKRFGHRVFDASTLTRFARDLGVFEESNTESGHRALDDVRHSVSVARRLAARVR